MIIREMPGRHFTRHMEVVEIPLYLFSDSQDIEKQRRNITVLGTCIIRHENGSTEEVEYGTVKVARHVLKVIGTQQRGYKAVTDLGPTK